MVKGRSQKSLCKTSYMIIVCLNNLFLFLLILSLMYIKVTKCNGMSIDMSNGHVYGQ